MPLPNFFWVKHISKYFSFCFCVSQISVTSHASSCPTEYPSRSQKTFFLTVILFIEKKRGKGEMVWKIVIIQAAGAGLWSYLCDFHGILVRKC